ncbi:alpha/beta fold hydrolase [Roseicella aquatilis]|uniref:Serine aminopeptidase S33 domain-containing protein n=1 Tax=Roseicella aquatilis TaxID=2527868 RepID=A0A4R4DJX4_9PROT|nr:alpha/beta fold hydrolase [Roseicella aquatilis]TCZ60833.1 hypothetical protein EXY23_13745 [Roseicella aquatilis]
MIPVAFGGCRGWFHPSQAGRRTGRGVVLCAPFGFEALGTYRAWRRLAEAFAARGLPTLRFDYPGTGDSAGEEAPGRLADWLDSIEAASLWLRRQAGVSEIALCGLRLGGALAAAVAARRPGEFGSLLLLAPVGCGRAYERELTLAAQTGEAADAPEDWLEYAGFRLHATDRQGLGRLDLAASLAAARVGRVLVAAAPRRPALRPAALARLQAAGLSVETIPFEGYETLLREAHRSVPPLAFYDRLADWAAAEAPPAALPPQAPPGPDLLACAEGVTERSLFFGPGNGLAGILCEPEAPGPAPGVLLLNTGADHHIGSGRLTVRLARRLAALGVTSLRMDATGLGDSAGPVEVHAADLGDVLFGDGALADVHAGLDALEAQGLDRCLLVGVCSGAHHAFQAALREPRVVALALANLPAFDRDAGGAAALDGGPPPGEIRLLRFPRLLLRRLLAETDRVLAERLGREAGLDRAGRWMRMLQRRGTRLLLAYSEADWSLRELRAHFGRRGRHLPRQGLARSVVLRGHDHSLNPLAMQEQFIRHVEDLLRTLPDMRPRSQVAPATASAAPRAAGLEAADFALLSSQRPCPVNELPGPLL